MMGRNGVESILVFFFGKWVVGFFWALGRVGGFVFLCFCVFVFVCLVEGWWVLGFFDGRVGELRNGKWRCDDEMRLGKK